tara:strand:+ start:280 stop:867 length:588 start_codon:yes stop_codon:yes gene_type:complete
MPTLDEITILPKNSTLAGNDNFAIADTSSTSSTLIEQVPAALVSKYTHAFLLNFDSASVNKASANVVVDLFTFDGTQIVASAAVIITKAFTGLGTDSAKPRINLGIDPMDPIPDNIVDSMLLNELGASLFNSNPSGHEEAEPLLVQSGHTLRALFNGGQTSGSDVNMSSATAGQAVILVNIIDLNDYKDLIPAID